MAKILISPGKYVQGAGEMKKLYDYAKGYGKRLLFLSPHRVTRESVQPLKAALQVRILSLFLIISTVNAQRMKSTDLSRLWKKRAATLL